MGDGVISYDTMVSSISDRVPPTTIDKNIKAFEEGIKLIKER
jgi:Pyruvate/2-oxoacid:ferredoxin oxidoreductase gamma subunit